MAELLKHESGTGQKDKSDGIGFSTEIMLKAQVEEVNSDGTYQQLNLNLFLSENEQISFIDR